VSKLIFQLFVTFTINFINEISYELSLPPYLSYLNTYLIFMDDNYVMHMF